jgi:hypothetical protein
MMHRTGFTAATLQQELRAAGFGFVQVWRDGRFGVWGLAR